MKNVWRLEVERKERIEEGQGVKDQQICRACETQITTLMKKPFRLRDIGLRDIAAAAADA